MRLSYRKQIPRVRPLKTISWIICPTLSLLLIQYDMNSYLRHAPCHDILPKHMGAKQLSTKRASETVSQNKSFLSYVVYVSYSCHKK